MKSLMITIFVLFAFVLSAQQTDEAKDVIAKGMGAILAGDEVKAREILKDYKIIKEECNKILHDLFSEDLPAREAVTTALLSRYLKRINSHMSNIASGVILPMDKIDFVRGDLLE